MPDWNSGRSEPNDYANLYGTSMVSPSVAGLAALLIDTYETFSIYPYTWGYSEYEALNIKMIVQMMARVTGTVTPTGTGVAGTDVPRALAPDLNYPSPFSRGQSVASGVYFARYVAAGRTITRRLAVVR